MEKMKELYEKVAGDSGLQAKFAEIMKDAAEGTTEKLVGFAKEAGYDVSIKEAQEFFKALTEQKDGSLSNAELDMVAGGKRLNLEGVAASIFSFGLYCAITSLGDVIVGASCKDRYDKDK